MRKTKIICTLGPSTDNESVLRDLMIAGMDAARFNFSHGSHEEQRERLALFSKVRAELGRPIPTILDTKGPEIRLGTFLEKKVELKKGQRFTLTTAEVEGDSARVSISYPDLPRDLKVGSTVLIDDGLVELQVEDLTDTDIVCQVKNNGVISDRKGVNVPGTALTMPYISPRDRADIVFGIENGFDFIAASFVRCAADIFEIRSICEQYGCENMRIIAKIENGQGVENIDEIIRASDGIMVARGDMGVEIPLEEVPILQKMLIKKVYRAGKLVITATQMLDSMMKNPRPTRAESTDVANAIYDGTSAIMLSGETAAGQYPVEAVRTMARIAERTEQDIDYVARFERLGAKPDGDVTTAISHATVTTAIGLGATAIVTVTQSGRTARMISKYRPVNPIISCTTSETVRRQLNLSWGVVPLLVQEKDDTDELFEHAISTAQNAGLLEQGDLVVITAGVPLGISGTTNLMKVQMVGHILVEGNGITDKVVSGKLCVCRTEAEAFANFQPGDILVVSQTSNTMLPLLKKAAGIITEQEGMNSHAAIVGLSLDIPVLLSADNALKILKSGACVTLDASRGIVSSDTCPVTPSGGQK